MRPDLFTQENVRAALKELRREEAAAKTRLSYRVGWVLEGLGLLALALLVLFLLALGVIAAVSAVFAWSKPAGDLLLAFLVSAHVALLGRALQRFARGDR